MLEMSRGVSILAAKNWNELFRLGEVEPFHLGEVEPGWSIGGRGRDVIMGKVVATLDNPRKGSLSQSE